MRLFETYPPSAFGIGLVAAVILVIVGLKFAVALLVGVALAWIGQQLDLYGTSVRRRR